MSGSRNKLFSSHLIAYIFSYFINFKSTSQGLVEPRFMGGSMLHMKKTNITLYHPTYMMPTLLFYVLCIALVMR